MSDKRYGYVVTGITGDLSVVPQNLEVGTILLEKRPRGPVTSWDFISTETGAFGFVAGRKIGTGHVAGKKFEWDGETPPEAVVVSE